MFDNTYSGAPDECSAHWPAKADNCVTCDIETAFGDELTIIEHGAVEVFEQEMDRGKSSAKAEAKVRRMFGEHVRELVYYFLGGDLRPL